MHRRSARAFAVAAAFAGVALGCRGTTVTPTPATRRGSTAIVSRDDAARRAEQERDAAFMRARERRLDSVQRAVEREQRSLALRAELTAPVLFELDQDEVPTAAHTAMDRKVAILRANPGLRLRIEGNADDRGSDEYNIALGSRRAAFVMRYLATRGVAADRIVTASNGEENPICTAQLETCWRQNRRADLIVTAGPDLLISP